MLDWVVRTGRRSQGEKGISKSLSSIDRFKGGIKVKYRAPGGQVGQIGRLAQRPTKKLGPRLVERPGNVRNRRTNSVARGVPRSAISEILAAYGLD
jgi:hypothetical protein